MKSILTTMLFVVFATSAFGQAPIPAASFAPAVAMANANPQLVTDLYSQLKLAQDMLAKVQDAQARVQKDLSDAQAKAASCKAF